MITKSWSYNKNLTTKAMYFTCLNTVIYSHLRINIIYLLKLKLKGVQFLIEKIKKNFSKKLLKISNKYMH